MKPAILASFFQRRRELDLDDPAISTEQLHVLNPEEGARTPRRMAVLFLKIILRQVLRDGAVAFNLFHDVPGDSLRGLEYYIAGGTNDADIKSREFLPAPGCFAKQVLTELRWRIGLRSASGEGKLLYKYDGARHHAIAMAIGSSEIRTYFTAHRPPMRTIGVPVEEQGE